MVIVEQCHMNDIQLAAITSSFFLLKINYWKKT